jgi:hypothetical protein
VPQLPDLTRRENFSAAMQIIILLDRSISRPGHSADDDQLYAHCHRLALLRQALGTQQLPPNQVLIGLAMFMTFLVMGNDAAPRQRRSAAALSQRNDRSRNPPCAIAAAPNARFHDYPDRTLS